MQSMWLIALIHSKYLKIQKIFYWCISVIWKLSKVL